MKDFIIIVLTKYLYLLSTEYTVANSLGVSTAMSTFISGILNCYTSLADNTFASMDMY